MRQEDLDIFGAAFDGAVSEGSVDATGSGRDLVSSELSSLEGMPNQTEPMCRLASKVTGWFRQNADHRRQTGIEDRLIYALNSHSCRYSPQQEDKMRMAGIDPRVFSPVTSTKIRAAKSLLVDLVNQSGDPLFSIESTPNVDVPQKVISDEMQKSIESVGQMFNQAAAAGVGEIPPPMMEALQQLVAFEIAGKYDTLRSKGEEWARIRARRMQKKVWDIFVEGGFEDAFWGYIDGVCTYGTGVIIGPIPKAVSMNRCKEDEKSGIRKYERITKVIPTFESVSPFDCYPAPDARKASDGPFCIRVKYSAEDLWSMCEERGKSPDGYRNGWNSGEVRRLLARHPDGGVRLEERIFDQARREAENRGHESTYDCLFEGIRCFASVRGSMLIEMGISVTREGERIELQKFYRVESVVIDGIVVYCRIYDRRLGVPIVRGVFYELPGSWWGESIADKLYMCQSVQNNCVKSLIQNMTVASGPMFWVNDIQRLYNKGTDALKFSALKTIAFTRGMGGEAGAPMGVVSVPSNANDLMGVFEKFRTQSDLDSGIPAFTEGQTSGQGGALRTASGLAIYTEASTRGMKMVMNTTDHEVIMPLARMTADWVLLYDDDMELKGDVEVRPVGLIGKILKAQRDQARLQLFQMVSTNQYLQQLLGPNAVIALFRPSVKDVDVNPDDVVPNEERMKELEMLEKIKQLFQAASQSESVNSASAGGEGGGASGVANPGNPPQPGSVAERRSVA